MKRIVEIDTLRGFALLGIFVMNIMSFAMTDVAYFNPSAYGGDEWFNRLTYGVVHVLFDQKFMALFSLLFGASTMLLFDKLTQKGGRSVRFFIKRNLWLFLIGILHSVFLWTGDVLTIYAICAFLLLPMRHWRSKTQVVAGLAIFLSTTLVFVGAGVFVQSLPSDDIPPLQAYWQPSADALASEINLHQGSYSDIMFTGGLNSEPQSAALNAYFFALFYSFFARALGMMLVGMALYRWGVVTAKRNAPFYRKLALYGFGLGLPTAIAGLILNQMAGWSATVSPFFGQILNLLATPLVAIGYIGLVMLWCRTDLWQGMQARLAATGQMALSNYIGQSVLAIFIFYGLGGFGLGLFGQLDRLPQLSVVLIVWAIQLIISPWWMARFRFGPLEWVWRSLSYWRPQPLYRSAQSAKG